MPNSAQISKQKTFVSTIWSQRNSLSRTLLVLRFIYSISNVKPIYCRTFSNRQMCNGDYFRSKPYYQGADKHLQLSKYMNKNINKFKIVCNEPSFSILQKGAGQGRDGKNPRFFKKIKPIPVVFFWVLFGFWVFIVFFWDFFGFN